MSISDLRLLLESLGRLARDEEERYQCARLGAARCQGWGLGLTTGGTRRLEQEYLAPARPPCPVVAF